MTTFAQELKVVSFERTMQAYASINKRLDLNDVPCAVLKISIPNTEEFSFESGFKVGDVIYSPGEAIVYLGEGARNITIKSDKYGTFKYEFPNRTKLEKLVTYRMSVKIPSLGIGGRKIAFGVNGGYLLPMISASSDGGFTGSAVNYALGNSRENASYSSSGGFSVGAHVDFRIYRSFHLITGINFLHYKYSNEFDGNVNLSFVDGGFVDYALKGECQLSFKENYTMSALEIPILVSYRWAVADKSHVQFNLGPVINYGLSSKMELSGSMDSETLYGYKLENGEVTNIRVPEVPISSRHYLLDGEFDLYSKELSYSEQYELGSIQKKTTFDESPFKRLSFGVKVGVAYEFKGVKLGVDYGFMLSNVANEKFWNGNRWDIFSQNNNKMMDAYKQRFNYLKLSVGYTFRY